MLCIHYKKEEYLNGYYLLEPIIFWNHESLGPFIVFIFCLTPCSPSLIKQRICYVFTTARRCILIATIFFNRLYFETTNHYASLFSYAVSPLFSSNSKIGRESYLHTVLTGNEWSSLSNIVCDGWWIRGFLVFCCSNGTSRTQF